MATFQIETQNANIILKAGQMLIAALKASEQKLGKDQAGVAIDFKDESGATFALSLTRTSEPLTGPTEASGGVQSGGSSASPGTVPAAPAIAQRTARRATPRARAQA